jgi:hypothetical protein
MNTCITFVSVDSKGIYVEQQLCNGLINLQWRTALDWLCESSYRFT